MAVDESLLGHANETGQATLRFYRWAEPTLSLGYFQKAEHRKLHLPSRGCTMVRRSSGGGAILHDQELTYSLSLPGTNRWSSRQNDLYRTVHQAIVGFLNSNGVAASQFEFPIEADGPETASPPVVEHDRNRFLCFERRTEGDIVLEGYKVGGSAQRRLSHATLQHGSLLLKRSDCAPELPGIFDVVASELAVEKLAEGLVEGLVEAVGGKLDGTLRMTGLSSKVKEKAKQIDSDKYGDANWTGKR